MMLYGWKEFTAVKRSPATLKMKRANRKHGSLISSRFPMQIFTIASLPANNTTKFNGSFRIFQMEVKVDLSFSDYAQSIVWLRIYNFLKISFLFFLLQPANIVVSIFNHRRQKKVHSRGRCRCSFACVDPNIHVVCDSRCGRQSLTERLQFADSLPIVAFGAKHISNKAKPYFTLWMRSSTAQIDAIIHSRFLYICTSLRSFANFGRSQRSHYWITKFLWRHFNHLFIWAKKKKKWKDRWRRQESKQSLIIIMFVSIV